LPALLLGMVLIVVVARRGARRDAVRALGVPIGRIAVIAGGACCVLMIAAVVDDANSQEYHWAVDVVLFLVAAVLIIATVIGVPLALVILFLAVRYWCAAADGHPMLPAVITLFFATIQLGIYVVDGGLPVLSPPLAFAIGVGGPLGLAGIAIAELWLHNTDGVSIRELP
jgi:hypothetical protein